MLPCQLWPNIRRDLRDSDISNADTLSDKGSGMRMLQRSSLILSSLPPQMTAQLFACASKRAAKAGEALFVAGDRGDGCYRVEQGLVKITVTSDRGEERIIALVGAGARTRVADAFCSTSGSAGRTWLLWPGWRARTSVAS